MNPRMLLLVLALAMPSAFGLTLAFTTGDPHYRPLGIDEASLADVRAPAYEMRVEVELRWSPKEGDQDQALGLAKQIKRTLTAKGATSWIVVLRDPVSSETQITYRVGGNAFGPYSVASAVDGVRPSVAALKALRAAYPDENADL